MESSASSQEWNTNAHKIKADHGGKYPEDWYSVIVVSGLAARVMERFGQKAEIKVLTL